MSCWNQFETRTKIKITTRWSCPFCGHTLDSPIFSFTEELEAECNHCGTHWVLYKILEAGFLVLLSLDDSSDLWYDYLEVPANPGDVFKFFENRTIGNLEYLFNIAGPGWRDHVFELIESRLAEL